MRHLVISILMSCACAASAQVARERSFAPHDFRAIEASASVRRSGRLLLKARPGRAGVRAPVLVGLAELEITELAPGLFSVRVPPGFTEERLADELLSTGAYEWGEPDWRVLPAAVPNDPLFEDQYHHGLGAMNTVSAWNMVRGDPSITIAVIDTGVDMTHPDLTDLLPGYNAIDRLTQAEGGDVSPITPHGTWVMGALGARGNNATGVAGAGWGFSLLPVRVSNESDGSALTSELVHAATWAADHGADIINVSYNGSWASAVGELGDELRARGVLLTWAAGNLGAPLVTQDWPGVTIVGATSQLNKPWSLTNYGPGVDVVAPGEVIQTTDPGGGYRAISGTSLATPLVAGVMGLIWTADPSLSADQVEQTLRATARDLGSVGRDQTFGWGLVNAGDAVGSVFTGSVVLPVPFADPLDELALDPQVWPMTHLAQMSAQASEEPTGERSLRIEQGGTIVSGMIAGQSAHGHAVRWYDSASGDAGLTLSYTDHTGAWHELLRTHGQRFESARFGWHAVTLPPDALHNQLRLSWSVGPWSTPVYIDSISIEQPKGIDPPWRESFDSVDGSPSMSLSEGAELISGVPGVNSNGVLRLADGASSESLPVLTLIKWGLSGVSDARLGVWVRPVNATGTLSIEIEGFVGWSVVSVLESEAYDPTSLVRWEVALPVSMLIPGDSKVRLRAQGGAWDVDDLFVTRGSPAPLSTCPSDLNTDGVVDLADLGAFATMYASAEPGADLNRDGLVSPDDAIMFLEGFFEVCDP